MIQLIGPGGAGKTAAGAALADLLNVSFVDLDAEFVKRNGDVSAYLETYGYDSYAERNVNVYSDLVSASATSQIVALSSGFMTYRNDVHPGYAKCRRRIVSSSTTFVLLPSLDVETCVAEIVRRQLARPFGRTAEQEEYVIRTRFPIYAALPCRKVATLRPVNAVVAELVVLAAQQGAARDGIGARPPRRLVSI
jgi:shikimate kinase